MSYVVKKLKIFLIIYRFLHHAAPKMKCCCGQLAPVEALPCSNEARGRKAYKRKTGRNSLFCTGLALQNKKLAPFKLRKPS